MATDRQPISLLLNDASEQAAAQPWLDLEIHQLSPGAYEGHCTIQTLDGMHLVHERQNQSVHKSGVTRGNLCAISIASKATPGMRFSQFASPVDSWIYFLPGQAELDVNTVDNSETFYLCLDQDALIRDMHRLNPANGQDLAGGPQAFNSAQTARLAINFSRVLQHSRKEGGVLSPNCASLLRDSVLNALNDATDVAKVNRRVQSGWRTHRLVSAAREYIDACLKTGRVPSIAEICVATSASERSLQYAFRNFLQLTPVAYLRTLRLNRVRADLLAATPSHTTVTLIAMRWGFVHLGDFSRDYRCLFGEPPSETLAQAPLYSAL
ncbi:helix-turn-helix domain-containing protein [Marinobacter sp. S6332]|uniref:helix-turn-helix domain-containing protein n=1 Tax=Marinobacter sp. S6332 TaxID=2926403 RepID=UPI001FF50E77|nr:helix-turn-helix domain-containing protein [Marinobacter sp. S6332]MCK0164137.1 helix-turn-helix domain-containing protein [Marinobacter sp. S6332]